MLHLILGRGNVDRDGLLFRRLTREGNGTGRYLIVPESSSHEMERKLCAMGENGIASCGEVLSFSRMANRVFSQSGGTAVETLDAGGRMILLLTALKEVSASLTVYARPSRKPAFLSRMLATIDELKSYRVTPEMLTQAEGAEEKLRDLALIYGAYNALTARVAADPRDRLERLAQALSKGGWSAGKEFYVTGYADFTAQERKVLSILIEEGESVTVSLLCDRLDSEDPLYDRGRKTAHQLLRLAEECGQTAEVEYPVQQRQMEPELIHLAKALFDQKPVPYPEQPKQVEIYHADSVRSEVEWAAAELRRLVREEGVRFREITVAARSFEPYRALVESIFPQYGLQVFTSAMTDVLEKPVLAVVSGAFDVLESGWGMEEVFRYLKTGLAGLDADEVDRLENYAETWDIRGSKWTNGKLWCWKVSGEFGVEEAESAELKKLNELRDRVVEPLRKLKEQAGKTGLDCCRALFEFLEDIDLPQRLDGRCSALLEAGQIQQAEEYRQLWDILCGALDQCAVGLAQTGMDLSEFGKLLKLVLSQYDVGSIPVALDRITAGELPRVSDRACKVLCLLGCDDGQIPQVPTSAGLLTDEDRDFLARYGMELLPRAAEKLDREWTILYEGCVRPEKKLLVFYPGRGSDGGEKRPSVLINRLKAVFPKLEVHLEGEIPFELTAPEPAIQSGEEGVWPALAGLPEYARRVERLKAARNMTRGKLSPAAVEALYGKRIPMSASRLDKVKSCHFSYFMQYGLEAKARKRAGFAAPEYGTFVHYVLECVLDEGGKAMTPEERSILVKQVVDRYVQEELGGMENQTPRFRYLFRRLERTVLAVVESAVGELAKSEFQPVAFELGFGQGKELPPITFTADGVTISLSGFVDRVDGWEKDGRLYLRVVDYKTGRKSFDWSDVFHGMGLQMLVYLTALQEKGKLLFGKEIVPAGVLYFPAREVVLRGSPELSDEALSDAAERELQRTGVILNDLAVVEAMEKPEEKYRYLPLKVSGKTGAISGDVLVSAEQLGKLQRHVHKVLTELTGEMARGTITADPFWRGAQKNACLYCEYAAACQFREGVGGDHRRGMKAMKQKQFWAAMDEKEQKRSKEVKEDGISIDPGTAPGSGAQEG